MVQALKAVAPEQNPSGSGNGPSCRTAEIIPLGNDTLYLVGTSVGLFGTANLDGQNTVLKQIGKNTIGNVVIETLTYRPVDGRLIVATHGNGIYQTTLNNVNNVLAIENLDKESFRFPFFQILLLMNFLSTLSLMSPKLSL